MTDLIELHEVKVKELRNDIARNKDEISRIKNKIYYLRKKERGTTRGLVTHSNRDGVRVRCGKIIMWNTQIDDVEPTCVSCVAVMRRGE